MVNATLNKQSVNCEANQLWVKGVGFGLFFFFFSFQIARKIGEKIIIQCDINESINRNTLDRGGLQSEAN